jgi:hypothetical protein
VNVSKVYHLGMGVDVVYLDLERVLMNRLPKGIAERNKQLLLAHRNEFVEGTHLFLLMKRYGAGDRLTSLHRLSKVEKTYEEKLQLIEQYVAIEKMRGGKDRVRAFTALVLSNLGHSSSWIRWNSLYELKGLLEDKTYEFSTGDVAYLEGLAGEMEEGDFQESLTGVKETMALTACEGPPLVEEDSTKETESVEPGVSRVEQDDNPQPEPPQKNHR